MHFLRLPNGLWFLQPGAGSEIQKSVSLSGVISASASTNLLILVDQLDLSVSVGYNITTSVAPLSSVELELSALNYRVSASISPEILASVDYAGQAFGPLQCFVTVTPVYTLDISGQLDKDVAATYPLSISASATINAFLSVEATYPATASLEATLATTEQTIFSVSVLGGITASAQVLLLISQDNIEKSVVLVAGITASPSMDLLVPPSGGLVWSQKKQKYIAVRVGS